MYGPDILWFLHKKAPGDEHVPPRIKPIFTNHHYTKILPTRHLDARPPNFTCGINVFIENNVMLSFFFWKAKTKKNLTRFMICNVMNSHTSKKWNISIENLLCHQPTKNSRIWTMLLVKKSVKINKLTIFCFVIKYYYYYPIAMTQKHSSTHFVTGDN